MAVMRHDALLFFLNFNDLLTIVGATAWANLVRRFVFVAVFTANEMVEG